MIQNQKDMFQQNHFAMQQHYDHLFQQSQTTMQQRYDHMIQQQKHDMQQVINTLTQQVPQYQTATQVAPTNQRDTERDRGRTQNRNKDGNHNRGHIKSTRSGRDNDDVYERDRPRHYDDSSPSSQDSNDTSKRYSTPTSSSDEGDGTDDNTQRDRYQRNHYCDRNQNRRNKSFGLCNAPAMFQSAMNLVLRGMIWKHLLAYLDYVIVLGKSFQQGVENLVRTLQQFKDHNLKLKPRKCSLFQTELKFLGRQVSRYGVSVSPEHREEVQNWPVPVKKEELESFLGFMHYHRNFVQEFAGISDCLYSLTRKTIILEKMSHMNGHPKDKMHLKN